MYPSSSFSKRLSCGTVILNRDRELLLCHVTGHDHWDLPKGGMETGESPLQTALRETREETGLALDPQTLHDLGRLPYTAKKDLHLFAVLLPRFDLSGLYCESLFAERVSGRQRPEMDGYEWVGFARIAERCTLKLAELLLERLDLDRLVDALGAPQRPVLAA